MVLHHGTGSPGVTDDLRLFHEFPVRECRVTLFSHGGHLLVAAVKDTIVVYNTITFATMFTLKGHQGQVSLAKFCTALLYQSSCYIAKKKGMENIKAKKYKLGEKIITNIFDKNHFSDHALVYHQNIN